MSACVKSGHSANVYFAPPKVDRKLPATGNGVLPRGL